MRVFAIYNPLSTKRRAAAWLLCDTAASDYEIEIADWATPADLPLLLGMLAENGHKTASSRIALHWAKSRVPPKNRTNIVQILDAHESSEYYLPEMLANTKGRSSQDDFLLEEVPAENYRTYNLNWVLDAPMQLGAQLSRARRAAGLTQMQLAEACGVQQAVISRMETGKGNPTLETLELLAKGCGRNLRISFE